MNGLIEGFLLLLFPVPVLLLFQFPSVFAGLGASSKQGILIKGSNFLEMLARCNTAVLIKQER